MIAIAGVSCGTMPATFFEMLASCIMTNTDGEIFLNVVCYSSADCRSHEPTLVCGDPTNDPEAFVVANAFTTDTCGNPALKLRICTSEEGPQ